MLDVGEVAGPSTPIPVAPATEVAVPSGGGLKESN